MDSIIRTSKINLNLSNSLSYDIRYLIENPKKHHSFSIFIVAQWRQKFKPNEGTNF